MQKILASIMPITVLAASLIMPAYARTFDYAPTYRINDWKVVCYDLGSQHGSCRAQHIETAPYVDLEFRPSALIVSVREGCNVEGRAPPAEIARRPEQDRQVYQSLTQKMNAASSACPSGSAEPAFTGGTIDIAMLLMRATEAH